MRGRGAAGHSHRGLYPDAVQRGAGFPRRRRGTGEGLHHGADAAGEGAGDHGVCHRPREQGGLHRRPQGAGAHGGLRAVFRGRPAHDVPHPAGGEKPLRRHQRDRRVRNAGRRAAGGGKSLGNAAVRPSGGCLRHLRHLRDGGCPACAGGGAGAAGALCRGTSHAQQQRL